MKKTDIKLGTQVRQELISEGIETPMVSGIVFQDDMKISFISKQFASILNALGLNLQNDSLNDTPLRLAKMYVNELFYGLDYKNFPKCTNVQNTLGNHAKPVTVKGIKVMSVCEHHFQTIEGTAEITYTPKDRVLGLSKFNRVVDFFSRRPQIQERLTAQIGVSLKYILQTDVEVKIEATHNCVKCRGVNQDGCTTITHF